MKITVSTWLVAAIAGIVGLWLLWAIFSVQIAHWFLGTIFVPTQAGPWGDSFGAFNAFFSALGFAAVACTLFLQMKVTDRQERDQHRQAFESSFFQLLTLFREVRGEVLFGYSKAYRDAKPGVTPIVQRGRVALRAAMAEVYWWIAEAEKEHRPLSKADLGSVYRLRIHRRYENSLSPYFRLVYTILDRIRTDKQLPQEEKIRFANILRSQLTTRELEIIALNALIDEAKDMKSLVEEYRLLKYLPNNPMRARLVRLYAPTTFTGRESS